MIVPTYLAYHNEQCLPSWDRGVVNDLCPIRLIVREDGNVMAEHPYGISLSLDMMEYSRWADKAILGMVEARIGFTRELAVCLTVEPLSDAPTGGKGDILLSDTELCVDLGEVWEMNFFTGEVTKRRRGISLIVMPYDNLFRDKEWKIVTPEGLRVGHIRDTSQYGNVFSTNKGARIISTISPDVIICHNGEPFNGVTGVGSDHTPVLVQITNGRWDGIVSQSLRPRPGNFTIRVGDDEMNFYVMEWR